MRKIQDTFQKVMPSNPDKSLRRHFHNLRRNLNRPIIETDAKSRGYKLPSQKQYKDLALLVGAIEAIEATRHVLSTKLAMATERAAQRAERHKERYKREPHLAKLDPHNHVNNNTIQSLKSRQKAIEALYSDLTAAYKELARTDYKPRSNANASI